MIRLFSYLLILTFLSCGGASDQPRNSNTELVVTYMGKEEHRRSKYTSRDQLTKLLNSGKEQVVVFTAEWCSACQILSKALKQAKLKTKVHYLNMDELWVQKLALMMEIKSVPLMIHIDKAGKTIANRIGPGAITVYLITRF